MAKTITTTHHFKGYASPNYTPIPDELFDEQLAELSGAELKVLLYIMRRTFGFKKTSDSISLKQMVEGISKRDGEVLDHGTGLSKGTATLAVKSLVEKGIIIAERKRSAEKGDEPTTYKPKFASDPVSENQTGGGPNIGQEGVRKSDTQYTEIQETDLQFRNSMSKPLEEKRSLNRTASSFKRISLKQLEPPLNQVAPHSNPQTEELAHVRAEWGSVIGTEMERISRLLNDPEHIRANTTQALNLLLRWGKSDIGTYISALDYARRITEKERIKKRSANGFPNGMPLFFIVLKEKLGISSSQPKAVNHTLP